ncbi:MAG: sigma-70 family RNA polymerase sigma factor, partial [Bacteroidota bacterium]
LFERYSTRIYNYCLKVTRDQIASEDLTQETFYKVIKYRKSFNNRKFAVWLFTISRNLCFDYFKNTERNELKTEGLESYLEGSAGRHADASDQIEHLRNTLDQLDPLDKELILLSRYEKMKYKDIATIMKMSESAIKNRIHRALKKLRLHYFKAT